MAHLRGEKRTAATLFLVWPPFFIRPIGLKKVVGLLQPLGFRLPVFYSFFCLGFSGCSVSVVTLGSPLYMRILISRTTIPASMSGS